jgi:ABC-2 type transport system ATP-binding protein
VTLEDASQREEALRALVDMAAEPPSCEDRDLRLPVHDRRGAIAQAVRRLDAAGVGVEDIAIHRPTLDDVFLALTGHTAEEAEEAEDHAEQEAAAV